MGVVKVLRGHCATPVYCAFLLRKQPSPHLHVRALAVVPLALLRLWQWAGFPAHPFVACDELCCTS